MFSYAILTTPCFSYSASVVDSIFECAAQEVSICMFGTVNIVFVSETEIRTLNATYRKKDQVTDVLSFHYFDDFSEKKTEEIVGEIVFCEAKILSQAHQYDISPQREFYKLLIHSLLHLV